MSYPEDALVAGETLVLHQRPHWKMLLRPVLFLLLILIVTGFLATVIADQNWAGTGWLVLAGVSALAALIFTGVPVIRWWTTHFVLTNKRVITRKGLIARDGLDIPVNRINSVRFRHSVTDRIFGTGTLVIESASDEPLEFDNIRRVEHVHTLFYNQVSGSGVGDSTGLDAAAQPNPWAPAQPTATPNNPWTTARTEPVPNNPWR